MVGIQRGEKIIMNVAKRFFQGLGIGVCIGLALYALGFVFELLACTCHALTCQSTEDVLPIWNWETFGSIMAFSSAGGAVIATCIGAAESISARKKRLEKEKYEQGQEAKAHRKENAKNLKSKAHNSLLNCEKNVGKVHNIVTANYRSEHILKQIMDEFAKFPEYEGKLSYFESFFLNQGDNYENT